ncbi:ankyrin [Stipitochalara longipes BDJ]|nr:ankyrin [Stipitochalara longipes BDJ]
MASPSASSVTLFELFDDETMEIDRPVSDDDDDDSFVVQDETIGLQKEDSPTALHLSSGRVADQCLKTSIFILPNHYTDPQFLGNEYTLSPSMRAALDPDTGVLKAVLSNGSTIYNERIAAALATRRQTALSMLPHAPTFDFPLSDISAEFGPNSLRVVCGSRVGITTPLMEAIRAGLSENVSTLLEAGANPNGVPLHVMEHYAAFFLRFRPMNPSSTDEEGDVASREVLLKCMDLPQISSITIEEVEDRFCDGMAPFWCEEAFTPTTFYHHGESMPSLVEAARSGTIDMLDMLLEAGADASFWMSPQFYVPDPPTESSLSVSSPLHAALQVRDNEMLKHLLDIDFDPNIMPLANPTRCFTPLMATIIYSEKFNKEAFDLLCSYPETNSEIRTPIYGVHLIHFAVAALNIDILKHVASKVPLKNAAHTALGHTLLHIACMPSDALEVQRHSEIIYKSIHETRDLHARNDPYAHCPPDRGRDPVFDESRFVQQTAVVKFLWDNGIKGIGQRDVHGNTPLHYLVGCRSVNQELLTWWLGQPGVDTIWRECLNYYEATSEEMFYSGEKAQKEGANGWRPWFKRSWTEKRVKRKQEIWRDLLGENARRKL